MLMCVMLDIALLLSLSLPLSLSFSLSLGARTVGSMELSKTVDPVVQEENIANLKAMGIQEVATYITYNDLVNSYHRFLFWSDCAPSGGDEADTV